MTNETQTATPAPDMVTMFSAALTEIINKMVDKRVEEILGNVATAKFMDTQLDERIGRIVSDKLQAHNDEFEHTTDLEDSIEHAFRYAVAWEDMVDERVREQVSEIEIPIDEDKLHDKVREVLNDVTFTVSVD